MFSTAHEVAVHEVRTARRGAKVFLQHGDVFFPKPAKEVLTRLKDENQEIQQMVEMFNVRGSHSNGPQC